MPPVIAVVGLAGAAEPDLGQRLRGCGAVVTMDACALVRAEPLVRAKADVLVVLAECEASPLISTLTRLRRELPWLPIIVWSRSPALREPALFKSSLFFCLRGTSVETLVCAVQMTLPHPPPARLCRFVAPGDPRAALSP